MAPTHASDDDAADGTGVTSTPDDAFVRHASLVFAVPLATDADTDDGLAKALRACARTGAEPRPLWEEQRSSLFFDETTDIYLVVRTPPLPRDRLAAFGARLALTLEAQILNGAAPGRGSTGASGTAAATATHVETIYSSRIEEAPLVVIGREGEGDEGDDDDEEEEEEEEEDDDDDSTNGDSSDSGGPHGYLVWKRAVFLRRPRARLHGPAVSLTTTATLVSPRRSSLVVASALATPSASLLRSRQPSGLNLLAAFAGDPALGDQDPRLSAQRVARVAPAGTMGEGDTDESSRTMARPLRTPPPLALKIAPAVHTRVRFARANHGAGTGAADAAVVALLEVDFTPFFDCEAVLTGIDIDLPGGTVTDLNGDGLRLPLYCVARDHLTFLYRLCPGPHAPPPPLHITLDARLLVRPGACAPRLCLSWHAALDAAPPAVNPAFGAALLPPAPLQRAHRPSQLSIDGMASFAPAAPDALPGLQGGDATEAALPNLGITLTLTAPATPVRPGQPFRWHVLVVNRSPDTPRRLALLVLPRRRRPGHGSGGGHASGYAAAAGDAGGTATGFASVSAGVGGGGVAPAALDDNIVHALQAAALVDRTDVVCLSSADDTRIGPLAPGACHAATLKFVALRPGIVSVDAVRVVDLGSQEHVDVRALPAMVISEA